MVLCLALFEIFPPENAFFFSCRKEVNPKLRKIVYFIYSRTSLATISFVSPSWTCKRVTWDFSGQGRFLKIRALR